MLEGVWIIMGTAKISAKQNGNRIVEILYFFIRGKITRIAIIYLEKYNGNWKLVYLQEDKGNSKNIWKLQIEI